MSDLDNKTWSSILNLALKSKNKNKNQIFKPLLEKNADSLFSSLEGIVQADIEPENKTSNELIYNIYDLITDDGKKSIWSYDSKKTEELNEYFKKDNSDKPVTITLTSCKRNDLLFRTLNSLFACFLDLTLFVKEIIIVDDNSSTEDRNEIEKLYPFIGMVKKSKEDKGHPKSMNMIYDLVSTEYLFHLEDDHEFFRKRNYFTEMIECLESKPNIGQCLVNINYAEDCKVGPKITGCSPFKVNNNTYWLHRHLTGFVAQQEGKRHPVNCFYWPHFSFRPSLIKVDSLKKVGKFCLTAEHFEMEFAQRWSKAGFVSAFLNGIFHYHIGRRTYERNSDKLNAYDLNQEVQFGETDRIVKAETKVEAKSKPEKDSAKILESIRRIETSVINLKRRKDRLFNFVKMNNFELPNFKVFKAVDGMEIKPNFFIQKLFSTGDFNYRRGIVGIALSQIKLWKELLESPNVEYALIFEDDAKLCKNFIQRTLHLVNNYNGSFDLLFLHWLPYTQYRDPEYYLESFIPIAERWSKSECMTKSMGSATCYLINKTGARCLLNHIDKHGVYNGIDWVMFKCADEMRIMYSKPMLAFAECVQGVSQFVDSDIQRDYNSCGYPEGTWSKEEINWWMKELKSPVFGAPSWFETKECKTESSARIVFRDEIKEEDKDINTKILVTNKPVEIKLSKNASWIWYTTDKLLFTVPEMFCTDNFLKTHQLFDHMLEILDL